MDLANITFVGFITFGVVNVIIFYYFMFDSKVKFGFAVFTAFLLTFVLVELGNIILNKAKIAIEIAFASSGGYKLATKMGKG